MDQEVPGLCLGLYVVWAQNLAMISRWIGTEASATSLSYFLAILANFWWMAALGCTAGWVFLCSRKPLPALARHRSQQRLEL